MATTTVKSIAKQVYNCLNPDRNGAITRANAYEALKQLQILHSEFIKREAAVRSPSSVEALLSAGHNLYQFMSTDPVRSEESATILLFLASTIAMAMEGSRWSDETNANEEGGTSVEEQEAIRKVERVPIDLFEMKLFVPLHTWATSTWWDDVSDELTDVCKDVIQVLLDDEFNVSQKTAAALAFFSASLDLELDSILKLTSPSTVALQSSAYLRQLHHSGHVVERVNAIADMSDSEIGQQVIRDLITSFLVPRIEMFPRHTTLFNSETTRFIMEYHPDIVRRAHLKAMLTGPHLWRNLDEGELERTCVILAGLAVFLAPDIDSVRKKSAFNGRIILPFLRGKPPLEGPTLQLNQGRWSCYLMGHARTSVLQCSGEGVAGLERCVLLFTHLCEQMVARM